MKISEHGQIRNGVWKLQDLPVTIEEPDRLAKLGLPPGIEDFALRYIHRE